jgi:hypothetical protein
MYGEIKYMSHVANDNARTFYEHVKEAIEKAGELYVEVQYQQSIQLNGKALWSALIIGRERNA